MKFTQDKLNKASSSLVITKAKNLPDGQFEAVLSTDDLDRHGERVSIKGLTIPADQTIKMYYNHETNGTSLPIGKWTKVWKNVQGKLMGRGEVDLEDDFAVKVYKKILKGYIDSISIGFYPLEFDGESSTWTKSNLVEASVVAEPANVNAVITSKTLGFTQTDFNKALIVKLKETKPEAKELFVGTPSKPPTPPKLEKGAVADELNQKDKYEEMEDFWEVVYAFSDAYYSPDVKAADFNTLLTETISILQTIVDGTYAFEDEDEAAGADTPNAEIKSLLSDLKSRVGTVEDTLKASAEIPATKTLIKLRVAAKQVDKAVESLNKTIKVKLKESN